MRRTFKFKTLCTWGTSLKRLDPPTAPRKTWAWRHPSQPTPFIEHPSHLEEELSSAVDPCCRSRAALSSAPVLKARPARSSDVGREHRSEALARLAAERDAAATAMRCIASN